MSGQLMRINGVDLHVAPPAGDGELLVLIHGGWTDHEAWAAVVPELARSFQVLSYDRRGHSRSGRGPAPAPRRQDEDDLAALIEALGGGPAHLVASSLGASIALALAGRRPDVVRSVVAHEPALVGLVPVPQVAAAIAGVQDQIAAGDVEAGTRRFFEELALGPGGWSLVPERVQRAAIANAQTFVDLREDPDWGMLDAAAVARFPGPILVTRGDSGPAWLPYLALGVADRIGRESRVIAGAGHSPHMTHPAELAALIEDFLGVARVSPAA